MGLRAYLLEQGVPRGLGDFESIEALDNFCLSEFKARRITEFLLDEDFGFDKTASYEALELAKPVVLLVALEKI